MSGRAVVLAGRGRYEDPWHDHAATSHVVALALAETDVATEVRGTFPDVVEATLEEAAAGDVDLLVVNSGTGRPDADFDGDDARWARVHDRLAATVRGGVALLALHQAANTFADSRHWAQLLGGRWVPEVSMHPPIGEARFRVTDADHPVTAGLGDVVAVDERYCFLEVSPSSRVLLSTEHEGRDHPVVWVSGGTGRVLYDALGHDLRSYASAGRRELLQREARWLLGHPAA